MEVTRSSCEVRVLLADDHPMVRQGVKHVLELQPGIAVVGEAEDTDKVLSLVSELRPDVVLLDINMPGHIGGGLWVTEQLTRVAASTKVLIFTFHDEERYIGDALRAGARGYVLKDADGAQLAAAIREVHLGGSYIHPSLVHKVFNQVQHTGSGWGRRGQDREELSSRELEVLNLIVLGRSNKEIGLELYISEKTVKNHISNILRKMGLEDRTQAAIAAVKQGIVAL